MGVKACPFLGHPCFQFKCFAVFGGCNIIDFGASDVPKTHILTFRKKVLPNSRHKMAQNGPKWPKMAQNGPKLHNYLCGCPFLGHSYFENKCFGQIRTCNIMWFFTNIHACRNSWHVICSQKNEKNLVAKFAKYYHFVIILLSSRERIVACEKSWHWISCGAHMRKNLLLKFAKYYHFVIIVINNIQQENCISWCFFLSFFWNQKITFFVASKHETIMLSFFTTNLVK